MDEAGEGRERGTETKENPHVERKMVARCSPLRAHKSVAASQTRAPTRERRGEGRGDRLKNGGGGGAGRRAVRADGDEEAP